MTIESDLRDRLAHRSAQIDIGVVPTAGELTATATKRTRLRRSVVGATTVLLILLVVGVGTSLRQTDPNAVFAGGGDASSRPQSVTFDGDRYVGITGPDPFPASATESVPYRFVTSEDGEKWTLVDDAAPIGADSAALAYHDGTFHLVSIRRASPASIEEPSYELVHSTTANLADFRTTAQPLPSNIHIDGVPVVQQVAAGEPGVVVSLSIRPDWIAKYENILAQAGIATSDVCDSTGTASRFEYRLCGETEMETIDVDPPVQFPAPSSTVFASPVGEPFHEVSLPGIGASGPGHARVYTSGTRLGISGRGRPVESVDATTWMTVETGEDLAPMIAARGEARVFRTQVHVARFGAADGAFGIAYSASGDLWQPVDLDAVYEDVEGSLVFFPDLRAGPAGWAMIAQRRPVKSNTLEVPGVERELSGHESDFVVTAGGYELAGHAPHGPATLTAPDGTVVRSWDQLEVNSPEWSGFVVDSNLVQLFEPGSSNALVTFTLEQWNAIAQPYWEQPFVFDLLFSTDGLNWSIVDTSAQPPSILAIGDNELVVRRAFQTAYTSLSSSIERVAVPLPAED